MRVVGVGIGGWGGIAGEGHVGTGEVHEGSHVLMRFWSM